MRSVQLSVVSYFTITVAYKDFYLRKMT